MSMFTLAICCLTTFNIPWFMDLTFKVPMQHCSSQHQILLSSADTSTTEHHFSFGSATSFLLELLVTVFCSSPVAYQTLSNLGGSSLVSLSFCFLYSSRGYQSQNTGAVCHSLFHQTTFCQNFSLWPVCLGWPCFTELHKLLCRDKVMIHEELEVYPFHQI